MQEQFTFDEARGYLAAMIDGEGWIGEPKGIMNRAVRISNTDSTLIAAIREACDILNISFTVHGYAGRKANWSPGVTLVIAGRANMRRIDELVPFRAARKRERLARTLLSYRTPEPLDPGRLRELVGCGFSRREIARELGVGQKRVILAMQEHNIGTAPRGPSIWRERRLRYGETGRRH